MKYTIDLACNSSEAWLETVMKDFPSFLQDHANCEREASAMAMSFVAKYPTRVEIIPELIETGIEELEHFQQVYYLMEKKGILLAEKKHNDLYIQQVMALIEVSSQDARFRDCLLVASVIECRACERFKLVSEHIADEELSHFYKALLASETKHGNLYVKMALKYFDEKPVYNRLEELMLKEAKILNGLEIRSTLH